MQNAKCKTMKDIHERTFRFACRVVRLYTTLVRQRGAIRPLLGQLLSAGTSVGANLEEAEAGQSRADFIAKCRVALKEARESVYWLRLLSSTELVKPSRVALLTQEAREIVAILTTIIRKASPRR
jgi:four helix bundle protein